MEKKETPKRNFLSYLPYLLIPVILIAAATWYASSGSNKEVPEYYEIIAEFDEGKVESFELNLSTGMLVYTEKGSNTQNRYKVPNVEIFINDIHDTVIEYNRANPDAPIKYNYDKGSENSWLYSILPSLLLMVALGILMVVMFRRMSSTVMSENQKSLSFGKARTKNAKDDKRKVTFKDVAGVEEEKEELSEIVEFLRNPQKFNDIGARIPKGVLLEGPPGTGKTLLARAVAGEADVPFFSISGSEFLEMYVGVGASRVRDLFDQAKKQSPAIIFIDEIDAVGRHRGAGMGGGHDEREQTLNQMLVEMDGFGANEGVIVIAATNRPDILDPALLRPGRFDRHVTVGYPDLKGREAILEVHTRNKAIAPDVDLATIARSTAGFTGADLENLMNEAALLAARKDKKAITMDEVKDATVKVMVGTEKKSHKMTDKEKKLTAYHEAGHAIATFNLSETQDPVHEISIIPRGMAGGYTMSIPKEDRSYTTKQFMLDDIVTLLGGRVSESIILGDISTGASNDIQRATEIARNMVTKYGMSDRLGPISYSSGNDEVFLGRDFSHTRNYSENIAGEIDDEVNSIISASYDRCRNILNSNISKLHEVAGYLIENEKMSGELFAEIMNGTHVPEEEAPAGDVDA